MARSIKMNNPRAKIFRSLLKSIAASVILSAAAIAVFGIDLEKNAKADLTVFRPSNSTWVTDQLTTKNDRAELTWGRSGDVLVPSDYDGDGRTDVAVWRPENGTWYIHQSGDGQVHLVRWGATIWHATGGIPDVPVPADYDGDGRTDIGIWRPGTGDWWILRSSNDYDQDAATVFRWGIRGDVPVQADYDGDGRADYAVFRSNENRWLIRESSNGKISETAFGLAGLDILVPADYTGDHKAEIAVYRRGVWQFINSETGETESFHLGFGDDFPVPADYDGDGVIDFAVYRAGTWYIYDTLSPRLRSFIFGQAGDVPVASGIIRESFITIP